MDIGRSLSAVSEELEAIQLRDKAEYKPKYARYMSEITL
ncbi:unnamed protein product [Oikopleura dioica]|uniref:Uncharacterized protein n=1 Tax=Oikopleura dioica TaxID=34765 RepID=E4YER9_OIKDI|nr:unnamed protein product [Oikopleura dioica]